MRPINETMPQLKAAAMKNDGSVTSGRGDRASRKYSTTAAARCSNKTTALAGQEAQIREPAQQR